MSLDLSIISNLDIYLKVARAQSRDNLERVSWLTMY